MDRVELITSSKGYKVYFKALAGPMENWKPIITILVNLDLDGEFSTLEFENANSGKGTQVLFDLRRIEENNPEFLKYINAAEEIYSAFDKTQKKFQFDD